MLGPGKTGSLVAEVARERGHQVQVIDADVNEGGAWLTSENLRHVDVVIDFTSPDAVLANIDACVRARKAMVVGTTGWYGEDGSQFAARSNRQARALSSAPTSRTA